MNATEIEAALTALAAIIPSLVGLYEKIRTNSGSNAAPASVLLADATAQFTAVETTAQAQ